MRKGWLLLVAVVYSVVALVGCQASEPKTSAPKEIGVGRPYDATTFDPANATDDGSYEVLEMIGEGLIRNVGGEIVPGIAERWTQSEDGLKLTFHLRKSKWSDGTDLTARDFEYSFKRLVAKDSAFKNADHAFMFANAERYMKGECAESEVGVKALGDYTLEITLEEPGLDTLTSLASYVFYPVKKAAVEAAGNAYGSEANTIVTNGPFNLMEWKHESEMVLVKNENYWNADKIKLNKITCIVGATGQTAVDMMLAGALDFCTTTDYSQMQALKDAGFTVMPYSSGYQFVHLNSKGSTKQTGRFMSNVNFRRALNYAVNRKAIVTSVFTGAEAATRITAPDVAGVDGLFKDEYPYQGWPAEGDPEKAREYLQRALEELGATIEDVPTLSMLCFESQRSMTVLQAVQDMLLNTLGIKCKIDPQPIQQMIAKAYDGQWDLWWGGKNIGELDWGSSWAGDYDYTASTNYIYGWYNDRYCELNERLETAMDMKVRKDTLFEMEKILCEDPPSILVGWTQSYACFTPKLSGITITAGRPTLVYADMSQ